MERFFSALRRSIESNRKRLLSGRIFLPAHLKKRRFVKQAFPPVVRQTAKRLALPIRQEVWNPFSPKLEVGWAGQRVDYVLGNPEHPQYFFEVESLNRSQLYLFLPHDDPKNESKLWYYWASVCKQNAGDKRIPRYFVWLLILPDQPVGSYPNWDCDKAYRLFDRKLLPLIRNNPFSFYDPLIKHRPGCFLRSRTGREWMEDGSNEAGYRTIRISANWFFLLAMDSN